MATTFFYSLPRMTHGFWDDEELNVRTTLWGKFKPNKKTGEVEFVRFDWLETIYGYSKGPNTHTLFSILSRACEEAWNIVAKPKGFPLVEWPFRVPALIFGVLAVAAFAWLLRISECLRPAWSRRGCLQFTLGASVTPAKRADTASSSLLFRFFCLLAKSDGDRALALVVRLCSR